MFSSDPVKRRLNPYPYCDNDPVNYVDPTGEIPTIVAGGLLGGAENALSQMLNGTGKLKSAGSAFAKGFGAGAVSSGLRNIEEALGPEDRPGSKEFGRKPERAITTGGTGRDPKRMCGSPNPFDLADGLGNGRGYHSGKGHGGAGHSRTGEGSRFSFGGLVKDMLIGGIVGGLGSAGFYGAGKVLDALNRSVARHLSDDGKRLIPGVEGIVTGGDSTKLGKNMMESMGLPRSTKWSGYQAQHIIPAEMAEHPILQKIGMDLDDTSNGLFLRIPADDISTMSRHRGYHSTYNKFVRMQLDRIDISQSVDIIQNQVYDLQRNLKYLQQSGLPLYPSRGASIDLWKRSLERIR